MKYDTIPPFFQTYSFPGQDFNRFIKIVFFPFLLLDIGYRKKSETRIISIVSKPIFIVVVVVIDVVFVKKC